MVLTRDQINRIAVPATVTALTLVFLVDTVAAMHTAVTASPGDTETLGTFTVISLMSAVCDAATGFLAWWQWDRAHEAGGSFQNMGHCSA